jgi:hypothetical protein
MFAGKHSLMQDSANEDAIAVRSIKDDVPLVLDAAVSWPNPVARAANVRSLGEPIEASLQAVEIAMSLLLAPGVQGVIGDIN